MSTTASVIAVCVNWNGRGVLAETVHSLLQNSYAGLEVLVVDNASTDESLASLPPGVATMKLASNLGYGGAINAAVQRLLDRQAADYFLLLNNDLILPKETVSGLMRFACSKGPGIFGPRIVRYDDPERLEAAWGRVSWSHVLAKYYGKDARKNHCKWKETKEVELLLGSFLLVHREVFEQVGLFDEKFFLYHEEVDLLYRTRQSGFPVFYCPFAEAIHRGGHSTRQQPLRKLYWVRKNAVYFLRKHHANSRRWLFFWLTLGSSVLYNILMLRWSKAATIWRAVREGLAG